MEEVKHEVLEFGDTVIIDEMTTKRIEFNREEVETKEKMIADTRARIAHDESILESLEAELAELTKYVELADAKKAEVESAQEAEVAGAEAAE